MAARIRLDAVISTIVTVHPHELPALLHSSSCFFFVYRSPSLCLSLCLTIHFECPLTFVSIELDIERVFRSSSTPRRRSNIAGIIKATRPFRWIIVSHSHCCSSFHLHLLFAQFVQIQGTPLSYIVCFQFVTF